ncbi:DNA replication/repair protein RecF [Mangrovitalea sediminis]|uniref:DNA replication/repair protein RecF n=1 Tax=Mangrovitalea sediminis TaxID=1982043 RepID=UPI000BE4F5F8|nr:DNA replication/repair protein RecF [Mangrovitalea sediminis]
MPVTLLQTQGFRNLVFEDATFCPGVNLIFGNNGSGKSSVLEAIGVLSSGRSFRSHRHEALVTHGHDSFTIFGIVEGEGRSAFHTEGPPHQDLRFSHRLGISRDLRAKETLLKLDGERRRSMSDLARLLPVSVIDPGTFDVIAGGPAKRRQFLDWMVFHVEHEFGRAWQQMQRVVSQRNQLLRNARIDAAQLKVWNERYAALADMVTLARRAAFEQLQPVIQSLLSQHSDSWCRSVTLDFFQGWDSQKPLLSVLAEHLDQEVKSGHTLYGPGRCDIRVRVDGKNANEVLSRGQQKTLIVLMKLAQVQVIGDLTSKRCTFLLDDINAELDQHHRQILADRLQALNSQIFVTSIERPEPEVLWGASVGNLKMFHVEQGRLTEET